MVVKVVWQW